MKVLVLSYVNNIQAILTYFDQMKLQCETLCVFMELMWKEKGKINHLSVVKIQSLNYKTFVPLGQFKFYIFYSPPFSRWILVVTVGMYINGLSTFSLV